MQYFSSLSGSTANRTAHAACCAAIALPWLNPFAPGSSPAVVPLLFSWLCAGVLFVVYRSMREQPANGHLVGATAWAWLLAGLLSAAAGVTQYLGADSYLHPWVNQAELGQAFANLRQRNQFASLTSISMAALLWFCLRAPLAKYHHMLLLAASLLAIGNAASSSRTGLVQLFMLCALAGVWGLWRKWLVLRVLLVSVVVYALAVLLLPWLAGFDVSKHGLGARLQAGDDACSSRLTLWSNVLDLIVQKPWLGWGWGELDYAHYMSAYQGIRFCDILDNAHNLPLHIAVELGIPLAVLLCAGALRWVWQRQPWAETDPSRQLAWSVLSIVLLHSLLEYPLWYGPFQIAVGLCVALLWRRSPAVVNPLRQGTENYTSKRPLRQRFIGLIAINIVAMCGYAGWDYHRVSQLYLLPESRSAAYRGDTLSKVRGSWLFASQVRFAELMTTPLQTSAPSNATWIFSTAGELLHYSPEPRVIEKRIEAAVALGHDTDALEHLARYRAAFAADYARWAKANGRGVF